MSCLEYSGHLSALTGSWRTCQAVSAHPSHREGRSRNENDEAECFRNVPPMLCEESGQWTLRPCSVCIKPANRHCACFPGSMKARGLRSRSYEQTRSIYGCPPAAASHQGHVPGQHCAQSGPHELHSSRNPCCIWLSRFLSVTGNRRRDPGHAPGSVVRSRQSVAAWISVSATSRHAASSKCRIEHFFCIVHAAASVGPAVSQSNPASHFMPTFWRALGNQRAQSGPHIVDLLSERAERHCMVPICGNDRPWSLDRAPFVLKLRYRCTRCAVL